MQVPSSATSSLLHESVDTPPSDSSSIIEWLMTETRDQRFVDNIFVDMCGKLNQAGIPVSRGTLHFRILHPQWLGARILWQRGMTEADIQTFGFGIEDSDRYRNSPVNDIHSGAKVVRQRLEPEAAANAPPYPLYDELRAEGHTDYIAWPLEHTLGKHHIITFGSDRPGGFSDDDIAALADLLPAFALVSEIRLKNRLARTLLETYVGPHASEQILAGATTRGSGVTVGAAILICDLRDFTGISDMWPRDDVIELLNGYFDAMAEPIERHGGEILKFMGDGLLAIFPLSNTHACGDLLAAIREAQTAMAALNEENVKKGHQPLGYGIGVHVGDVIAGCEAKLENVGSHRLRGLSAPIDVFAY
jgi:adenylate cyclase